MMRRFIATGLCFTLTWLGVFAAGFNGVFIADKIFAPLTQGLDGLTWAAALPPLGAESQPPPDLILFQAAPDAALSAEASWAALKQAIGQVQARFPEAQVAVVSPLLFPQPSWYAPKAVALREKIEAALPALTTVGYVDLRKVIPVRQKKGETYYDAAGTFLGARGMDVWQAWVEPLLEKCLPVFSQTSTHGVVYSDPRYFAAWPANGGSWVWGDEMLVVFICAPFVEKSGHNLDLSGPQWYVAMRSLDGGKTWTEESHPILDRASSVENARAVPKRRDLARQASPGIDFSHPDLAVMMSGGTLFYSYDRGRTWQNPVALEVPTVHADMRLWARTAYVPLDKSRALFFLTEAARDKAHKNVERGHSFAAQTTDGGKTFSQLGGIGDFLKDRLPADSFGQGQPASGIMPSVVRTGAGTLVAARRSRLGDHKWTDIYRSSDEGKSWQWLSKAEIGGGTPPALVYLPQHDALALIYANRFIPYGIRGRLSKDGGRTWSAAYALREDAREWDIGYNRAHVLDDGRVITFYYYTTPEKPQQFIAWTIWDPTAALSVDAVGSL